MQSPVREVHDSLLKYFDALYFGKAELFRELFHPRALLFCATDGASLSVVQYLDVVAGRQSPSDRKDPRRDQILGIDVPTPTTAHARVSELFLPKVFTDELTFVLSDGSCKIISKVWHFELLPNA